MPEPTNGQENQTEGFDEQIELTKRQRARIEKIKTECANDHLPEPSDKEVLKSLLDTWDAVNDGLYSPTCPTCENQIDRFETADGVGGLCPHCQTVVSHRV